MTPRHEIANHLRNLLHHREIDKEAVEDILGLYMGECVDGYDPVAVSQLADIIDSNDNVENEQLTDREKKVLEMWPRYVDNNEPVMPLDKVFLEDGSLEALYQLHIGAAEYSLYTETDDEPHPHGHRLRRYIKKPDTWEQLEEDIQKTPDAYFNSENSCDYGIMHLSPYKRMAVDIVRRAKALANV